LHFSLLFRRLNHIGHLNVLAGAHQVSQRQTKRTATDSGSFDCINSIHGASSCSRSDKAIRATISTHEIWAEGISSGRAHSNQFAEGLGQTPRHAE
jgi:hypothetical protein